MSAWALKLKEEQNAFAEVREAASEREKKERREREDRGRVCA